MPDAEGRLTPEEVREAAERRVVETGEAGRIIDPVAATRGSLLPHERRTLMEMFRILDAWRTTPVIRIEETNSPELRGAAPHSMVFDEVADGTDAIRAMWSREALNARYRAAPNMSEIISEPRRAGRAPYPRVRYTLRIIDHKTGKFIDVDVPGGDEVIRENPKAIEVYASELARAILKEEDKDAGRLPPRPAPGG